jgi:hypothetical protein
MSETLSRYPESFSTATIYGTSREHGLRRLDPGRLRAACRRGHVLSRAGRTRRASRSGRSTTAESSGLSAARIRALRDVRSPAHRSWSKGRNGHYAYYLCQRQRRAVNVSKAELEGAFADELAMLQPTAGYMRLVKDRILHVWEQRADRQAQKSGEIAGISAHFCVQNVPPRGIAAQPRRNPGQAHKRPGNSAIRRQKASARRGTPFPSPSYISSRAFGSG